MGSTDIKSIARQTREMFDALVQQGFSHEDAMRLVVGFFTGYGARPR